MIEHKAPSTFEVTAFLFEGGVVDHFGNSVPLAQIFDDILPALMPAQRRIHRKQRDTSVLMRRNPVVWENRIRLFRLGGVIYDVHDHVGIAKRDHREIKFPSRSGTQRIGIVISRPLKSVVRRGLRIRIKSVRADHQHRVGALRGRIWYGHLAAAHYATWADLAAA